MKRSRVHTGFALLTGCSVVLLCSQWLTLRQASDINQAIAQVWAGNEPGDPPAAVEVQLAMAGKLTERGEFDEAERHYSELIRRHDRFDPAGQAARFNLGNTYLRQSLDRVVDDRGSVLPLIELAKQRYRDVLRAEPLHWDARYNLERALRLAPEIPAAGSGNGEDPVKRVRVIVPDFETRDLP